MAWRRSRHFPGYMQRLDVRQDQWVNFIPELNPRSWLQIYSCLVFVLDYPSRNSFVVPETVDSETGSLAPRSPIFSKFQRTSPTCKAYWKLSPLFCC
ncbi:hypothetical protein BDW60DRAFT_195953 [Aspergillus nidulans var. acristatus]